MIDSAIAQVDADVLAAAQRLRDYWADPNRNLRYAYPIGSNGVYPDRTWVDDARLVAKWAIEQSELRGT